MRILGGDPGSRVTGYGVVEAQGQNSALRSGGASSDLRRLQARWVVSGIFTPALTTLIQTHGPTIPGDRTRLHRQECRPAH